MVVGDTLDRDAVMGEIAELLQRLAIGGTINALELQALREHIAQSLSDPSSPTVTYYCRQGACNGELIATNAPYGRATLRCNACRKRQTIYFGGYQRRADTPTGR